MLSFSCNTTALQSFSSVVCCKPATAQAGNRRLMNTADANQKGRGWVRGCLGTNMQDTCFVTACHVVLLCWSVYLCSDLRKMIDLCDSLWSPALPGHLLGSWPAGARQPRHWRLTGGLQRWLRVRIQVWRVFQQWGLGSHTVRGIKLT